MFRYLNPKASQESTVPEIRSLSINSNIQYRYAHTLLCSKVHNAAETAQEIEFGITIPETAFITSFCIEVDGKVYDAYVKEKEEAKKEYQQAVRQNRTAAHVSINPRDSSRFTVSVNIEPKKDITFHLKYEELLIRKLGTYKHVINLDPGQIVPDFKVEVNIKESTDITILKVPELKDSNETQPDEDKTNSLATIERPNPHTAVVKFSPTPEQQKTLYTNGIKGQLIVQYDVDRKLCSSQLLVNDGYFAHYFAPEELKTLPKHITFVLDESGSMNGRKIQQLKEAMEKILSDLNPNDYFSLLSFSSETKIWRLTGDGKWDGATLMESDWKSLVVPVNKTNVLRGKLAIQKLTADGGTNIYEAMSISTHIAQLGKHVVSSSGSKPPEPIIILLTDGEPTVGNCDINEIINEITRLNQKTKATIFTLGLGRDVDFNFLKKLALQNSGFCRKIYEASDTALQLMDFYKEVASPLVSDINFIYQPEQVNFTSLTTHIFPTYFHGTELIVCGVIDPNKEKDFHFNVTGLTTEGKRNFEPLDTSIVFIKDQMQKGFMERLWAYLTIQQLLEEEKRLEGKLADEKKKHATELALKYSFVTPVTSLVVVKPDDSKSKADQSTELGEEDDDFEILNNDDDDDDGGGLLYRGSAIPQALSFAAPCNYSAKSCHSLIDDASDTDDGFIIDQCATEADTNDEFEKCTNEELYSFNCIKRKMSQSRERSRSRERTSPLSEAKTCSQERKSRLHSRIRSSGRKPISQKRRRRGSGLQEERGRISSSDRHHSPKKAKQDISFVERHRASSSSSTQSQPHRFLRKIKKLFNSIGNIIEKKKSFESPPQQQESAKGKKNVEHVVDACVEKIIQEGYLPSEVPYTDTIRNIDTDEDVINRIEFYMNNVNIKIREQSKEYKLIIREEIKNHAVFLKFECITLRGRHLLSIYLQFTHQGKITNRMLGILQPGYDCSAQKLEDFIQRKLKEIDLKPENIICAIVSDGNLKLEESHENYANEGYWYLPESKFLNIENVLQALHTLGISTSLCPLDALQFVMYDTIQTIDDIIILKTRYVAEKLKSLDKLPKDMTYITDESQYDWGQICKLLKDITTLQHKCKEHNFTDPDLLLNKQQWDVISDANKILNNEALLELLNREYLVFGDYYEKWMHHAEKIAKQGLSISDVLSRNLKKRANDAPENTIFLAQLFFDSRFKNILNADQELFATEQLKKIWLQLAQITGDSKLKRIDIVDKVQQFNSTSKIQKDESLLDYWVSQKETEPELYKLATTLISIPICRRKELSENVKFLLDPMQEDITEDIVFVRCFKMFNKT